MIGTDKSIPWQCDGSGDSVANAERCREVNYVTVTVENELRLNGEGERNSRGKWWLLGDKREPPKTPRIPSAS